MLVHSPFFKFDELILLPCGFCCFVGGMDFLGTGRGKILPFGLGGSGGSKVLISLICLSSIIRFSISIKVW